MKNLQNNFTTPEQSKRLLELGVPADSADMYYHLENYQYYVRDEFSIKQNDFFEFYKNIFYPCWSVGRLMEIFDICCYSETDVNEKWENYNELHKGQTYINYIMYVFDHNYMCGKLNFSKLED